VNILIVRPEGKTALTHLNHGTVYETTVGYLEGSVPMLRDVRLDTVLLYGMSWDCLPLAVRSTLIPHMQGSCQVIRCVWPQIADDDAR